MLIIPQLLALPWPLTMNFSFHVTLDLVSPTNISELSLQILNGHYQFIKTRKKIKIVNIQSRLSTKFKNENSVVIY